jgi:toxin ParE1/3/4
MFPAGFRIGNYLIFYRPEADGVQVIRILHGRRDIPKLFE